MKSDRISINPHRLIGDAKELAVSLVAAYTPGRPRSDVKVGGESAFAMMKLGAWTARQGGYISDYDVVVAEKLAHVLSGGRLLVECLARHGVDVVFGIPGAHTIAIYDALHRHRNIKHILVRHEQSAALMADGY